MKTVKALSAIIAVLILSLTLFACSGDKGELPAVMALKGPTGMGMAKLIDEGKYEVTLVASPDEVSSAIISGSVDIAAVPINLASVLYNKTNGGVKLFAINTLGVLYILENGNSINSVADLNGKTIAATGQGSTPEYILRYILTKNGINPDSDVTLEWYTDGSELATNLAAGNVDIALLPEPNVTAALTKSTTGNLRVALDMTAEWDKVSDTKLIQGVMVVRSEYYEANKKALEEFMSDYSASVDWVLSSEEAPALIASLGIVPSEGVAKNALPRCNITYIDGDMKGATEDFYRVLFDAKPESIGGKMPGDDFYLNIKAK